MDLLLPLLDSACRDVAAVGGKAVNLHWMLADGLPVPDGFVVTTRAYRRATETLSEALEPLFERLREPEHDAAVVSDVAARIHDFVRRVEPPAPVVTALTAAYAALGDETPVAVRSSATAEDLADASFAGQHDTYLHVIGATSVIEAVRACWASLWTTRAVFYRRERGIDPADVALAVVVQRMVEASSAGVMFTADPVTGSRRSTVIDANAGLGESVVSGEANPDRYVVDSATRSVRSRRLGDRAVAVRPRPGGGVMRETVTAHGALLTDAELAGLADLGRRAEHLFGAPQDTEWAIDASGTAWLTQARAITTLFPLVQRAAPAPDARPRLFLCASLAQGLTRPITPLGRSAVKLLTGGGARIVGFEVPDVRRGGPAYAEGGQRIFGDITSVVRNPVGRRLARFAFLYMETRSGVALRRLDDDPNFSPQPGRLAAAGAAALAVGRVGRMLWASRLPLHAAIALRDPDEAVARIAAALAGLRGALDLPADTPAAARLDAVEELLSTQAPVTMPGIVGYALPGFAAFGIAHRLAVDARPGELECVLRGLPHNVTTTMDLELWALSQQVAARGGTPSVDDLAMFLSRWGDRAVAEIDLGMPRWRERPEHLLGALGNYARFGSGPAGAALDPAAQFESGAAEAERAVAALLGRVANPVRRAALTFALDRARRLVGLREAPKFGLVTLLARAREQLLLIGEHLVADGRLDAPEDVVFLDVIALREGLESSPGADLRAQVGANRAAYDAELRRRHIPRLVLSDGTELEALTDPTDPTEPSEQADGRMLTGTPASSGVVRGAARVITDPIGAQLQPGEILIAPSTDPGWTPLFLTAGALVMEMGGANSHGPVVAREYGIPAVVGVPDACALLRTGETLTVDGAAGTVRREDPEGQAPEALG